MSDRTAYAGDISCLDAWQRLQEEPQARLIDVRTQAEWAYVGIPDLSGLGRAPVLIEWQSFPRMAVDPAFAERLEAELASQGAPGDAPLLFLCRSGARSASAAAALTARGRTRCFNIADGFEGPLDEAGHRNTVSGWKARGLPWRQS